MYVRSWGSKNQTGHIDNTWPTKMGVIMKNKKWIKGIEWKIYIVDILLKKEMVVRNR